MKGGIYTRKIWSRQGTKQLSIPAELVERHEIENGEEMELIINWEGFIYLAKAKDWGRPKGNLLELIGPYLVVPTTARKSCGTLYFTIPSRMYLSNSLEINQPVIMITEEDGLIRIIPIHEEMESDRQDAVDTDGPHRPAGGNYEVGPR